MPAKKKVVIAEPLTLEEKFVQQYTDMAKNKTELLIFLVSKLFQEKLIGKEPGSIEHAEHSAIVKVLERQIVK